MAVGGLTLLCATATATPPAAAAPVRSSSVLSPSAVSLNSKWGQRVSLKTGFTHSLLQRQRATSQVARQIAVAQLSEFAVQESAKFREGLLQQLEANPTTANDKVQIAEVCSKIFGDYLDKYDGSLSPEPFGKMKEELDSQKLPGAEAAICAALGWSRGYLYHDWKMSQEKK